MLKVDIEHAVSFTGHRPERLDMPEETVIKWLEEQIRKSVDEGYRDFISGMQRGVDLWAAEYVLRLKEEKNDIRLFSAIAFRGMENRWEKDWQTRYYDVYKKADDVIFVGNHPSRAAFFKRNEWMVDNSKRLIAVYTGAPGGTKATIQYAEKHGREIVLIDKK